MVDMDVDVRLALTTILFSRETERSPSADQWTSSAFGRRLLKCLIDVATRFEEIGWTFTSRLNGPKAASGWIRLGPRVAVMASGFAPDNSRYQTQSRVTRCRRRNKRDTRPRAL